MKRVLVTGATGNVGLEVIRYLVELETHTRVVAGVRNVAKAKNTIGFDKVEFVEFDFENPETFQTALIGIECVFLLRPPHISDVERYFMPLMESMKRCQIAEVVFLSVQGAEKSSIIPHNKIEKLIEAYQFSYIFIRPSYFMQNLTTTLLSDLKETRQIILPAGKGLFNWVDINNIAEACALVIDKFSDYRNQAIEVTGYENENFCTVATLMNQVQANPVKYVSVNPFRFYRIKRQQGMPTKQIIVMLLLHFLPRLQKAPKISNFYQNLTGKKPTTLKEFIVRETARFS